MSDKELLLAFVSKALNMDAKQVASLIYNEEGTELKPEAESLLISKQTEFVSTIKTNAAKSSKDDGYAAGHKDGWKEGSAKLEAFIKDEFGISSEATGLNLIKEASATKGASTTTKEVTEDDVKKHKTYLDLHAQMQKQNKDFDIKLKEETDKIENKWKRTESMREVNARALDILTSRKPVLSKDPAKAKNQQRLLLDELSQYNFDIQGSGADKRYVVLDKDGKPVEDNLGHPLQFEALVTQASDKYYDFEQSDERQSPGNINNKGQSSAGTLNPTGITLRKPTSDQDWFQQHDAIDRNASLKPEEKHKLQVELKNMYRGNGQQV